MSSSDAASTLSVLEKLPTEVVGAIGSHLELAGLKTLRLTSKAMNNHLEFNLRELFKEIKCQTTLAEFEALARFQKQPLAKAVESLVWVKPGSNCCKLTIVEERRKIERDPDDRGLEEIETLKGSFFPPPEIPDLDLQRMIAKSVNEFPNLRAIGLAFKADPSIPGLCDLLEDEDLQYWAGTVCQIEKPLDVRAICTKFKYGICWTGSKETSRKQIIETSVPTDMIIADQDFWKAEFTTTFNILQEIRHELLGQDLRAVEFSRVAMDIRHFTYLFARAPLVEEVTVRESIITGLDGFIWEQKCDIPFMASPLDSLRGVRVVKLSIIGCKIQLDVDDPIYMQVLFESLADHGHLQELRFEKVTDITFDWDSDGNFDDGSRLPSIIDRFGVAGALEKMMGCLRMQPATAPKVPETTFVFKRIKRCDSASNH